MKKPDPTGPSCFVSVVPTTCGRLLALLLAVPGLFTAAPGLVVAPTALLLGALGLFAPAPAAADVLVSNLGQSWWGTSSFGDLNDNNVGQQFTTGSNQGGYILNSVQLRANRSTTNRPGIVAELWSSNGSAPDSKITDLTPPSSFPSGQETSPGSLNFSQCFHLHSPGEHRALGKHQLFPCNVQRP